MKNYSDIWMSLTPAQVRSVAADADTTFADLEALGISFSKAAMDEMMRYAGDAAPTAVTTPSVTNALQFLQYFFPQAIEVVTAARVADQLLGRTFAGAWSDEQVVMPIIEMVGQVRPYGDDVTAKQASWNNNFEARTIVRFELALTNRRLESERAAKMRVDSASVKRRAVANALAIAANDVAFNGFNNGAGHTYGILNDPNLGAYRTAGTGAGGTTTWATKTFKEIVADIRSAFQFLRTQTGGNFDPKNDASTLGIALGCMESLNFTTDYGMSVQEFMDKNYPKCRIVGVPQFNAANSGANVFYAIADTVNGSKCADQIIQQELFLVGAMPQIKGIEEDYSNATAGVLVGQPIGVVRVSGI